MAWNVIDQLNKNAASAVMDDSPKARFRTKDISIRKMYSNDNNFYSMPDIEKLAQDIYVFGLIENLEVVYAPCERGDYRITAGERRWRALNLLVEQGHREFEIATCQIQTPQSDNEERLRLIVANAYRNKTVTDILEEERQLKEILQDMRDNGQTLKGYRLDSGRLRDVIADMLRVPASKIGQIESINRHLLPEFTTELKEGRLTFTAAYEISGMTEEAQKQMLERYRENGLTFREVREAKKQQEEAAAAAQIAGQLEIEPDGSLPGIGDGHIPEPETAHSYGEHPDDSAEEAEAAGGMESRSEDEYIEVHPESVVSLCYSCKNYSVCEARTAACISCDRYIDKAESEKTPEQLYDEEQAAMDRETRRKLSLAADEQKMQQLPSDTQRQVKIHEVKIGATFFEEAACGKKNFELRRNDRGYRVGDMIELQEYRDGAYTGRICRKLITYMLEDYTGLQEGYCILGCELIAGEDESGTGAAGEEA